MITIDLRHVGNIKDMVEQLSPIFSLKDNSKESISLNLKTAMLYPEYLTMIVSAFTWAKEHNIELKIINILKDNNNHYPERINFYKLINFLTKVDL